MSRSPETRPSLLVRLKDRTDQTAWYEFTEIYQPVIYRLARRKEMQHADAEDLTQLVLMAVSKVVERWEHEPQRARFRTWLHRVAHNAILNALTRGKTPGSIYAARSRVIRRMKERVTELEKED